MKKEFNVMLIALEQKENYLDIRSFKTMDSAYKFGKELKDYNENFTVLGIFNVKKSSNHSWEMLIYDKVLNIKHQVFVNSKKECKIVTRMFLEYENKYNITFKKKY
jgi:ribosomal protein S10